MALTYAVRLPGSYSQRLEYDLFARQLEYCLAAFQFSKLLKNLQQAFTCLHPVEQPEKNAPV